MRRIRLTRVRACLLSLFMPVLVGIPAALVLPLLPNDLSPGTFAFILIAVAAFIIAVRVHFASWYAGDKGRSESWGLLGALGILGWLVLWSLEDRGFRFTR